MGEPRLLRRLACRKVPIRLAIIGAGKMGRGLIYQSRITLGFQCVAVADICLQRAETCVEEFGFEYRVVDQTAALRASIGGGAVAVCEDGELLAQCETVDVLIESSSSIGAAARYAVVALEHGKHVVMMNAEADLLFGPYLLRLAEENGVIYTSCDGDQHGVLKRLLDEIRVWGFEPLMAGNIKGFLDRYSNPTKIIPEADKRQLDYRMASAFTDGTKLCIEMALLANSVGFSTLIPGMEGPQADRVEHVLNLFDFAAMRESGLAYVDYILGAEPGGGVFVVGYCDNPYQQSMLSYYKMGDGPFYLFYRPYHLCHIEAMIGIAEAVLDEQPLLQPEFGFQTNVYAYAKRPLRAGETLDGVGGYCCYGLIENCADHVDDPGLPICLSDNVRLKNDVPMDGRIRMHDAVYDAGKFEFELYDKAVKESNPRHR